MPALAATPAPSQSLPGSGLPSPPPRRDDPLRGILLVITATLSFGVSDGLAKHLSATLPAAEIAWLRWLGFVVIMLPAVVASRGAVFRSQAPRFQLVRSVGLVGSSLFFISALHYLPMASATTMSFVAPLLVTALSIPLLGETVGIRRWIAIVVGLLGVVIVVRPGTGAFDTAAILPLMSALFWAVALISTRLLSGLDHPRTTMTYAAFVGFALLSFAVPFQWVTPQPAEFGLAALMAVCSTGAQFLVVNAYRYAPVSVLAPFSYAQLISSVLIGFLVFQDAPDVWVYVGAAVIIASGLYTAHRERLRSRARDPSSAV